MSTPSSRHIRAPDRALIWSRSGGICCFPDCGLVCVEEANEGDPSVSIGEIAHIEANSDGGPRANPSLSLQARNSYPNLILFCPTHHTLVDAQENTYTVGMLRAWKTDAEERFLEIITQQIGSITFSELDVITRALADGQRVPSTPISVIPPQDKMDRNGLTEQTGLLVRLGMVQSTQVQEFVETMAGLDGTFVQRLTSGFVNEYRTHRQAGLEGDSLFEALRRFSAQRRTDIKHQCAGLAVLVYLFERCEVFEQ